MTPGFAATQADVGGTRDTWSAQGNYTFYHGKTGTRASFDGFRNQYFIGAASGVGYITDSGNIEELQLETSGMGAESGSGSTILNAIPKSGSNTFAGGLDGYFSNGGMQGANIDDNLNDWRPGNQRRPRRDQSAPVASTALGAQLGGPIMQDRIWFFAAVGRWGSRVNQPERLLQSAAGHGDIPATASSADADAVLSRAARHAYATRLPDTSRPAGQLRLVSQPRRCGITWQATDKQPVQLLRRHPEVVPLHHRAVHRRQRHRVRARLGLVAVGRRAGHVDGADDQPAAARSRRLVADGQLGELRRSTASPATTARFSRRDQLPLRRDARC